MDGLGGKAALVIGGSSGIGLAMAKGFAAEGVAVAIAARSEAKVHAATAALREFDAGAAGFVTDVSADGAPARLLDDVVAARGLPDILVNCQGTTVIRPSVEVSEAEYDRPTPPFHHGCPKPRAAKIDAAHVRIHDAIILSLAHLH
ncbi:MAG: SDR family NAD(P)-dependent oxidoreductase [Pseudomonadota bacterium]